MRGRMGRHISPESCVFEWNVWTNVWSVQKMAEPIEMLFTGLTLAGSCNNTLVGWAHWRHLVNTTEPSALLYKQATAHTSLTARTYATAPIPLPLLTHSSATVKSPHKNPPRCGLSSKILDYLLVIRNTRAVQPVATCRQSSSISQLLSLWRHSHYDV